jgi:hypothetical protein
VEEYFKEMEMIMMCTKLEEREETNNETLLQWIELSH